MDICFECIFEGKKLFRVLRGGSETPLFTGTMAQCRRFLEIYEEKTSRSRQRGGRSERRVSVSG